MGRHADDRPEAEAAATRAPAIPFVSAPEDASSSQQASPATQRLPSLIEDPKSTQGLISTLFIEDQEDRTLRRSLPFLKPLAQPMPTPAPLMPAPAPPVAPAPAAAPAPPVAPAPAPPVVAPVAAPIWEAPPAPAPQSPLAPFLAEPLTEPVTEPEIAPEPPRVQVAAARPRLGAIELVNDTALALAAVPWG